MRCCLSEIVYCTSEIHFEITRDAYTWHNLNLIEISWKILSLVARRCTPGSDIDKYFELILKLTKKSDKF